MSKSDRYRGLRPNPHTLGVEALEEGEVSYTLRVRTTEPVRDWLKRLGAKRVGELLEWAYKETQEKE